ncbi:MAG TPA: sulfotransferase [Lacipirellulaceae bacterium]|nr:sulfotransferase [Lacipirellulaceae bacterium]
MKKSPFEASLWLGVGLGTWLRLLARNRLAITPARWPMAAAVTLAAGGNSLLGAAQEIAYRRQASRVVVPDDPIFIVGHWRTGTTMLHELFALDVRHRCPTTYESLAPNHFLLTERLVQRFARFILPRKRPFDNMRMSFDRPQEDEAALALRGVPSPFLSVAFPRRPLQHPEYVDLDGLPADKLAAWQSAVRDYLRLLLLRRPGRLVLKSPQHTNRAQTLGQMFPRARFVHVVRDPYVVYASTVHFWTTMYEHYGLQRADPSALRAQVLADFAHMHERFEQARSALGPERVHDVRYERLARDPLGVMQELYHTLELGDFAAARPAIERYAERSQRYRTNEYELDAATCRQVTERWHAYFARHGYAPRAEFAAP